MDRCDFCMGRIDRPALLGCDREHEEPDLAQKIVKAIERNLTDRRGLRQEFEGIDRETQEELRDAWAEIVRFVIRTDSTKKGG